MGTRPAVSKCSGLKGVPLVLPTGMSIMAYRIRYGALLQSCEADYVWFTGKRRRNASKSVAPQPVEQLPFGITPIEGMPNGGGCRSGFAP